MGDQTLIPIMQEVADVSWVSIMTTKSDEWHMRERKPLKRQKHNSLVLCGNKNLELWWVGIKVVRRSHAKLMHFPSQLTTPLNNFKAVWCELKRHSAKNKIILHWWVSSERGVQKSGLYLNYKQQTVMKY